MLRAACGADAVGHRTERGFAAGVAGMLEAAASRFVAATAGLGTGFDSAAVTCTTAILGTGVAGSYVSLVSRSCSTAAASASVRGLGMIGGFAPAGPAAGAVQHHS